MSKLVVTSIPIALLALLIVSVMIFLWKSDMSKLYKALFSVSLLLNFVFGFEFFDYVIRYSYMSDSYNLAKDSFKDLALIFPKKMSRQDIEKAWPGKTSEWRATIKDAEDGFMAGGVRFYFNENGTIKTICSSHEGWPEEYSSCRL